MVIRHCCCVSLVLKQTGETRRPFYNTAGVDNTISDCVLDGTRAAAVRRQCAAANNVSNGILEMRSRNAAHRRNGHWRYVSSCTYRRPHSTSVYFRPTDTHNGPGFRLITCVYAWRYNSRGQRGNWKSQTVNHVFETRFYVVANSAETPIVISMHRPQIAR